MPIPLSCFIAFFVVVVVLCCNSFRVPLEIAFCFIEKHYNRKTSDLGQRFMPWLSHR